MVSAFKQRTDIPILKGTIRMKKMITGPEQDAFYQNLARCILPGFKAGESSCLAHCSVHWAHRGGTLPSVHLGIEYKWVLSGNVLGE